MKLELQFLPFAVTAVFIGGMLMIIKPTSAPLAGQPASKATTTDYQKLLTDIDTEEGKFANACDFAQIVNGAVSDGKTFNVTMPTGLRIDVHNGGMEPCGYTISFETDTAYITKRYGEPLISTPKVASSTP